MAARIKVAYYDSRFYGGLFGGRRADYPDHYARTFNVMFTGFTRSLNRWTAKSFEGKSEDERAVLNGIIDQELTRLFKKSVRPAFRAEAPEDPTDTEEWNAPYWRPPTLRDSIMKSPLIKQSLGKGELEVALRMRWYGWLTIEGRRAFQTDKRLRFKLKNGQWVSVGKGYMLGASTQHSDPLTGEGPEERMGWAGRAYYRIQPDMRATKAVIVDRIMNEGLTMSLRKATAEQARANAAAVQAAARAQRQRDLDIFRRNI